MMFHTDLENLYSVHPRLKQYRNCNLNCKIVVGRETQKKTPRAIYNWDHLGFGVCNLRVNLRHRIA